MDDTNIHSPSKIRKVDYLKEPYETVAAKLELAELTIELGKVTLEKWNRLEAMKEIMSREEDLIKRIAEAAATFK